MVDAIIVLGGGISDAGVLFPHSMLRVKKGVELWKEEKCLLVFSGRWNYLRKGLAKTEAQAMKECALKLGVPAKDMLLEEESMDTIGNAYFCNKRFIVPKKWKDVFIVTSGFHVSRTKSIFRHVLKVAQFSVISAGGRPSVEHLFREWVSQVLLCVVPWDDLESYLKKKYR